LVSKASEPLDILWCNLGEIKSHFSFLRFFLLCACLLICIFVSSPIVLFTKMQKADPSSIFYFKWTDEFGFLGPYLKRSLPTCMILLINLVILLILDFTCVLERYDAHSKYQTATYTKCVIYLILNMFVIPVLTIASEGKTIYELLITTSVPSLLSELFIPKAGEFFAVLLI